MKNILLVFSLALLWSVSAKAEVISGEVTAHPQYPSFVDLNEESFKQTETWQNIDLQIGWSSAGNPEKTGYLYAAYSETLIADTQGVEDICAIMDASNFSYYKFTLGWKKSFVVGKIYLFHNPTTKFYAAFKVLSHTPDNRYGERDQLTGAWYLQTKQGSADFSCK